MKFQAGSETTVTFLKFLILYMVNYPSVQSRLQEEVDRVVGRDRKVVNFHRGIFDTEKLQELLSAMLQCGALLYETYV